MERRRHLWTCDVIGWAIPKFYAKWIRLSSIQSFLTSSERYSWEYIFECVVNINLVVLGGDQWSDWSSTRLIFGRGYRWVCAFRLENALEKKTRRIQSIGRAQITRTGMNKLLLAKRFLCFLGYIYVNAAKWSSTDSTISPRPSISTRIPSNGWWSSGKRINFIIYFMVIIFIRVTIQIIDRQWVVVSQIMAIHKLSPQCIKIHRYIQAKG